MAHGQVSTTIARSPAEVFAILIDVGRNAAWSSSAVEGRQTTPGPIGVGTRAWEVSTFLGRRIEVDSEIVAFEPDQGFAYLTTGGPFPFQGTFACKAVDGGTWLTATFEARLRGPLKVVDGLFAIIVRRKFGHDLANLKRLMESRQL